VRYCFTFLLFNFANTLNSSRVISGQRDMFWTGMPMFLS
jgi:hypothetical protein